MLCNNNNDGDDDVDAKAAGASDRRVTRLNSKGELRAATHDPRSAALAGVTGGQPHVYVITTISLAEFMFMKEGQ